MSKIIDRFSAAEYDKENLAFRKMILTSGCKMEWSIRKAEKSKSFRRFFVPSRNEVGLNLNPCVKWLHMLLREDEEIHYYLIIQYSGMDLPNCQPR